MRSMISARLGSPVSASCKAWWRSSPVFSVTVRSALARPVPSTNTSKPEQHARAANRVMNTSIAFGVPEHPGGNVRSVCGDRPPVVQVDRGRFGADRDLSAVEHRVRRPDVVGEGHCIFGLAYQRPAQHHLRQDCHPYPTQERCLAAVNSERRKTTAVDGGQDRQHGGLADLVGQVRALAGIFGSQLSCPVGPGRTEVGAGRQRRLLAHRH